MTDVTKIEMAKAICIAAHKGQVDKAGADYYLHPFAVSDGVTGTTAKICALLHDVLEDTTFPREALKDAFGDEVIEILDLLNHGENEPYMDYIKRVATNDIAVQVKLSDLNHNMDLSRIANPTPKDIKRLDKYREAKAYLIA